MSESRVVWIAARDDLAGLKGLMREHEADHKPVSYAQLADIVLELIAAFEKAQRTAESAAGDAEEALLQLRDPDRKRS